MINVFKEIADWWNEGKDTIKRDKIESDAVNLFNIVRVEEDTYSYDAITYNGVVVSDAGDVNGICDKLYRIRKKYIADKLKER